MSKKPLQKRDIVNRTGGVETADGRTLYGLDAETYVRMQGKEDPTWKLKVMEWMEAVAEVPLSNKDDLWLSLKDGIYLCEMVNKMKPNCIPKVNRPKANQATLHPLMERENITKYLEICYKVGIPSRAMFAMTDLHKKENMAMVLSNIKALSDLAPKVLGCKIDPIPEQRIQAPKDSDKKIWEIEAEGVGAVLEEAEDEEFDKLDKEIQATNKKIEEWNQKIRSMEGDITREKNMLKRDEQKVKESQADVEGLRKRGKGTQMAEIDALIKAIWELAEAKDVLDVNLKFPSPDSEEAKLLKAIDSLKDQIESERKKRVREVANAKSQEEGRCERLEAEVTSMQENATAIASEMSGLRSTLGAKKEEVASMQQLQQELDAKLAESERINRGAIDKLKNDIQSTHEAIQKIVQQTNKEKSEAQQDYKTKMGEGDAELTQLNDTLLTAEKAYQELLTRLKLELAVETKELRDKITAQQSTVNNLEFVLRQNRGKMQEAVAILNKRLSSLEKELADIDESETSKVNELNAQTKSVKEKFDQFYTKKYQEIKDIVEEIKVSKSNAPERATSTGPSAAMTSSAPMGLLSPRGPNPSSGIEGLQKRIDSEKQQNNLEMTNLKKTMAVTVAQRDSEIKAREELTKKIADDLKNLKSEQADELARTKASVTEAAKENEARQKATLQAKLICDNEFDEKKNQLKTLKEGLAATLKNVEKEKSDLQLQKSNELQTLRANFQKIEDDFNHELNTQKSKMDELNQSISGVETGSDQLMKDLTDRKNQGMSQSDQLKSDRTRLLDELKALVDNQLVIKATLMMEKEELEESLELLLHEEREKELRMDADLKQRRAESHASIERLQLEGADEVDRLNEEIVEIRNTKAELQQEHNRKIADMNQELEDLKQGYENELNNFSESIAIAEREIELLNEEKLQILSHINQEMESLKANLNNNKEFQNEQINNLNNKKKKTVEAFETAMKELLEKKKSEKEAFQEEFAAFEKQIYQLEKDLDLEDEENETSLNGLRDELDELTAQLTEAEKQRDLLLNENSDKRDNDKLTIAELEKKFQIEYKTLSSELESLRVLTEDLELENETKRSELSQMIHNYEMSVMDKQNDYAMQLRSNLQFAQAIKDNQTEEAQLKEKILALKKEIERDNDSFDDDKYKLEEKRYELMSAKEARSQAESELEAINVEWQQSKAINYQLVQQRDVLRRELDEERHDFKMQISSKLDKFMTENEAPDIPSLVYQFRQGFYDDENRREFTNLLSQYAERPNKGKRYQVPQLSFPGVGVLTGFVLGGLDLKTGGTADFFTAKMLLECAGKLITADGQTLTDYVKSHKCWGVLSFWSEIFTGTIPLAFVEAFPDGNQYDGDYYSAEAQQWMINEITLFGKNMLGWGHMGYEQISAFTQNVCTNPIFEINLNQQDLNIILKKLESEDRIMRENQAVPSTPKALPIPHSQSSPNVSEGKKLSKVGSTYGRSSHRTTAGRERK